MKSKVAIVMGSDSDLKVVNKAILKLKYFEIPTKVFIMSAHKSPETVINFAKNADLNGFKVIIAAAGMAAHLAGIIAAHTTLPVIGIPINCSLNGLDALFSTLQMPRGVPVLTVGIDGCENAAIAACQILALHEEGLKTKLQKMKTNLEQEIKDKNKKISSQLNLK